MAQVDRATARFEGDEVHRALLRPRAGPHDRMSRSTGLDHRQSWPGFRGSDNLHSSMPHVFDEIERYHDPSIVEFLVVQPF